MTFSVGNDLARALKWGKCYKGEDVGNILRSVKGATNVVFLDRYA